jgi:hypothetical protein
MVSVVEKSDCAYWANFHKIKLQGGIFSLEGREYLYEPMESRSRRVCAMKATGMGWSECLGILPSIHGMIFGRYPQGVLYMFPTNDDVQDFSKSRFNPLISANRLAIGKYVKSGGMGTDTAALKKVGSAFLYLRGARLNPSDEGTGAKFSTKLTGIQVDRIVPDEIDQMDSEAIAKARGRMGNACVDGVKGRSEERYIANPSDEDRGIDLYWQLSDQREWFVKCVCGAFTCALHEFMSNPEKCVGFYPDGKGYIRCSKCEKPLGNAPGQWVIGKPSVTDLDGYQGNHLNSIYHDPARILRDFTNPPENNLGDVFRLDLGLPYSSAEDKLQKDIVLRCCGQDIMPERHEGPCAMGVDVKGVKHVVIGTRTGNDRYEIVKVAEVQSFGDVHDLGRRYNVKSAVVDIRPYEDEARQFQKSEGYKVFLCEYTESPLQEANFNDNTGVVKAYRTGIFDATHRIITNGQVRLPRRCKAVEDFAAGCCKCVKSKEVNKKTGQVVFHYRKTGDQQDDYRNALNYFVLAASGHRIGTVKRNFGSSNEPQFVINDNTRYI